ncbi:menaquinone biosynthetic enzyme MqnA/MqnD family protein [Flavihumibacter fluvii]|uniref:menaquinone biosynthetic enzyme MqnA/MqnD family protein n=1 Tax=Flavihumibacter fluvii TaxID=2838157 RepID=UPI001BDEC2B2|nr:menaquinone biosynthesis protein [Flavihumibacter fluvii]ULQ53777.1 menaquinone biosynthesis protein [Flavihumibacter fluvii]
MDRKIRVGAVSYLNTKPLIYGLEKGMMKEEIDLVVDFPANIASKLLNDEIDLGLVPVALIPRLGEYHIVSDFGICSNGPVASVCLFSEVPIIEVKEVLLDYQSRTSVRLAKILLKEYWKVSPDFSETHEDFRSAIAGSTAGVVIGDRALEQRLQSTFIYDLGEAWKQLTGLPFVYAAWISNKKLDDAFIFQFNATNKFGLDHIEEVIKEINFVHYPMQEYFTHNIDYRLDEIKKSGLAQYLHYLEKFGL